MALVNSELLTLTNLILEILLFSLFFIAKVILDLVTSVAITRLNFLEEEL